MPVTTQPGSNQAPFPCFVAPETGRRRCGDPVCVGASLGSWHPEAFRHCHLSASVSPPCSQPHCLLLSQPPSLTGPSCHPTRVKLSMWALTPPKSETACLCPATIPSRNILPLPVSTRPTNREPQVWNASPHHSRVPPLKNCGPLPTGPALSRPASTPKPETLCCAAV